MKPPDLDALRTLMGKISQRYGAEPADHLKAQPGAKPPTAAPTSNADAGTQASHGDLAIAAAIHHLAEVLDRPRTRVGVFEMPNGAARYQLTVTESGAQRTEH